MQTGTVAFDIDFRPSIRAHHPTSTFFAGDASNPTVVKQISTAGAVLATHTLTGNNSIDGLAVSGDGTVIYHGRGVGNAVRRWVGGTNGTNLAAAVGGYRNGYDIVVLDDDTILVSYFSESTGEFFVRRYNDGGTLLQTYAIETTSETDTPGRLAYDITDPEHFYTYTMPAFESVRIQKIELSSGDVVLTRDNWRFDGGDVHRR